MSLANLSTKRQRIAELARTKSGVALSTLHHVLDLDWMREAYRLTRKDGAPGIDGVTAAEYAQNLEANLWDLLERIKTGRYQAPPVRRVYIPKGDGAGSLRPLGLAVVMVLVAIYEQDSGLSYRDHRGALAPTAYASRMMLPPSLHGWLPAARLGRESNPLDHDEKVSELLHLFPPSWIYPDATGNRNPSQ